MIDIRQPPRRVQEFGIRLFGPAMIDHGMTWAAQDLCHKVVFILCERGGAALDDIFHRKICEHEIGLEHLSHHIELFQSPHVPYNSPFKAHEYELSPRPSNCTPAEQMPYIHRSNSSRGTSSPVRCYALKRIKLHSL